MKARNAFIFSEYPNLLKGVLLDVEAKRDSYLNQLISYQWNGQVKVITGIRRSGKSYLLFKLYRDYLLKNGVKEDQIIQINLELQEYLPLRNPIVLEQCVRELVKGKKKKFYLFIDEIQLSDPVKNPYNPEGRKVTLFDALNSFRALPNLDTYVTGSNSMLLAANIPTEFRGRSNEIRMHPLSFAEYYPTFIGGKHAAFETYALYGGMPTLLNRKSDREKADYLKALFDTVYIKDIIERHKIRKQNVLEMVIDLLSSSIGSFASPKKMVKTLKSKQNSVSIATIYSYLSYLKDAFLFSESKRYDVKGKGYFDTVSKYYSEDIGLRNARLNFRQQEMPHIMENIIYNELIIRGFSVDVGIVTSNERNKNGNSVRVGKEIDFVATRGNKKVYIQSAYVIDTEEKRKKELRPFLLTRDSFPKVIVRGDTIGKWYDDNGILNIDIVDFLLNKDLI